MKDNSLENSLSLTLIESGKRSISGFSVPSGTVAICLPTIVDGFEFLSSVERRDALKLFWIFMKKKHFFFLDLAITAFIFLTPVCWGQGWQHSRLPVKQYVTAREDLSNSTTRDQYRDTPLPPGLLE